MKKRTILIVIGACLLISIILVFVITDYIMTEGSMPTDDEIVTLSDKLIDDSIEIFEKYPADASLKNEEEWPESIKALSPLSLWATREGLYITTKERFVQGWGIFIPREDSEKYIEKTTMPSYKRIVKGIYRFYAD